MGWCLLACLLACLVVGWLSGLHVCCVSVCGCVHALLVCAVTHVYTRIYIYIYIYIYMYIYIYICLAKVSLSLAVG